MITKSPGKRPPANAITQGSADERRAALTTEHLQPDHTNSHMPCAADAAMGSGYPAGIRGSELDTAACLLAAADATLVVNGRMAAANARHAAII